MNKQVISLLAVAVVSAATTLPAFADARPTFRGGGAVRGWGGQRDIRHFDTRHLPVWRSGAWHHGRHDGTLGWWWVVGGVWYLYPAPIYPYPDPYVPYVVTPSAPPPPQYWYYCEPSGEYYPYVATCPAGWKPVPATPPSTPAYAPPK